MATINFGGVLENVVTREEFSLNKAQEILKNETVAVIGYGVQGPGQALNLKDNNINVIVGQRKGTASWNKAVADGWEEGKTLFDVEEACKEGLSKQFGKSFAVGDFDKTPWKQFPMIGCAHCGL